MKIRRSSLHPIKLQQSILRKLFRIAYQDVILYAAFPKSASHHLLYLIETASKEKIKVFQPKIIHGFGHNFISEEKILNTNLIGYQNRLLLYGHIPYHQHNSTVLKRLHDKVKIIISIRSLPDVVISYKEHIDKKGYGPLDHYIDGTPEVNPEWFHMNDEKKYDFIIDFIIPWYIRFIMSWISGAKELPVCILTFEEHTSFPYETVLNLSKFLHIKLDLAELNKIINPGQIPKSNFNKGISGRGMEILSDNQLNRIEVLLRAFGESFYNSNLCQYLLRGVAGLPFGTESIVEAKPDKGILEDEITSLIRLICPKQPA